MRCSGGRSSVSGQGTVSMRIALADLRLDSLTVVYPGSRAYALEGGVRVLPATSLADADAVLGGRFA